MRMPFSQPVLIKYRGDFEPVQIRARGGILVAIAAIICLLPAAAAGVITTLAVAAGSESLSSGFAFALGAYALFGALPLFFSILTLRWDSVRWLLLSALLAGGAVALGVALILAIFDSLVAAAAASVETSWLWAIPGLGLAGSPAAKVGRPLPTRRALAVRVDRSHLPAGAIERTHGVEVVKTEGLRAPGIGYELHTPEAVFRLPENLGKKLYRAFGRVRYDLRRGLILTIWDHHGNVVYNRVL